MLYFSQGCSRVISKQSGSEQAFITLRVDFHTAQDGGSGYFLRRDTLTLFPNLLPLLQAPLGPPCLQLGHPKPTWWLQVSLGLLLLWHTSGSLSAPLAHTQTFPGDGHATALGGSQGRGKDLLMSVRSTGTAEPKSRLGCSGWWQG